MPTLADYVVVSEGSFEIDTSSSTPSIADNRTLTMDLPTDFTVGTNLARPVLKYILNFRSDSGNIGIWVNPTLPLEQSKRVETLTWNKSMKGFDHALWTIVDGRRFVKGGKNQIVFAFQPANKGHVRIRNVVLWFQRDI